MFGSEKMKPRKPIMWIVIWIVVALIFVGMQYLLTDYRGAFQIVFLVLVCFLFYKSTK